MKKSGLEKISEFANIIVLGIAGMGLIAGVNSYQFAKKKFYDLTSQEYFNVGDEWFNQYIKKEKL